MTERHQQELDAITAETAILAAEIDRKHGAEEADLNRQLSALHRQLSALEQQKSGLVARKYVLQGLDTQEKSAIGQHIPCDLHVGGARTNGIRRIQPQREARRHRELSGHPHLGCDDWQDPLHAQGAFVLGRV